MSAFHTVKEAADLTGKSPSSIRRIIYPIIRKDTHPDRAHVQPSVEDVLKLRLKGENFAWRLSEELLRQAIPADAPEKGSDVSSGRQSGHGDGALIDMLRHELGIKNTQIAKQAEIIDKQMELVNGLSERLREGNILISNLQQRLALPDGRPGKTPEPVKVKHAVVPGKGSSVNAKPAKPRKGIFSRFFSR